MGLLGELWHSSVPEPIPEAAWRRLARFLVWMHVVLVIFNSVSCALAPFDPTVHLPSVWRYLEINVPEHLVAIALNLWQLRGRRTELEYRRAAMVGIVFTVSTVIVSLWLGGSVTSWNYLWLPIAVFSYRVYFDARMGQFVLLSTLAQYAALIGLELSGVVRPHALMPDTAPSEYLPGHELLSAIWIMLICAITFAAGSYVAHRIRSSEHALRELNRTLEERVAAQVSQLERTGRLRRYLAPQVVERLLEADVDPVAVRERRPITVMFADLKGFTPMTESLAPEVLSAVLTRYFDEVAEIAFRHGGTIDKFIGDAVMVFFGAPEATGPADQALRCVRMALEVQRRLHEVAPELMRLGATAPLEARIGIASGLATVGEFGAKHRTDFTAVGSPVNRAARLEPLAPAGGILIDAETEALVGDRVVHTPHGEHKLKGFAQPQAAFLVERMSKIPTLKDAAG
jgi:class 3 adenylate cyclase